MDHQSTLGVRRWGQFLVSGTKTVKITNYKLWMICSANKNRCTLWQWQIAHCYTSTVHLQFVKPFQECRRQFYAEIWQQILSKRFEVIQNFHSYLSILRPLPNRDYFSSLYPHLTEGQISWKTSVMLTISFTGRNSSSRETILNRTDGERQEVPQCNR